MTAPSPEAFLAQPSTDEDDFEELPFEQETVLLGTDPLISIAESLRQLVALTEARDADQHGEELRLLGEAYDDLEAKHRSLFDLLAEVEKIVKPSTSKLANSVREAITRSRKPEVPDAETVAEPITEAAEQPDEAAPERIVEPAVQCPACARYFADQDLLDRHDCAEGPGTAVYPAADAPVEEWREYARRVSPGATDVDRMNRSQIRTLLGLPHFEA